MAFVHRIYILILKLCLLCYEFDNGNENIKAN